MAEDTTQDVATDEPHGEPDYKAMYEQAVANSRKWEQRSKANAEKAKAYDALADGDKTPEQRLAAIAAELDERKASDARNALVAKVASETGVSAAIVATLNGADEESLTEQAKAIFAVMPHGAPSMPEAGVFPREQQISASDADMRRFVRQLVGKDGN